MKFIRLYDSRLSVIYEDEDIVAIDKPYGFNAHTNDSISDHGEFIEDGLIEIYQKNRGKKLHVIHRLDQTTTGVMIFGKSVESAKKYAQFFLNKEVKKTYWFLTDSDQIKEKHNIDQIIIHKGKELEAQTEFNLLKKNEKYQLWQALPKTGRNHQIRIHAKAANISVLGDPKYGGANFKFLCLHNHQIEFFNGISIKSKDPVYFKDLNLLNNLFLLDILFQIDRRERIYQNLFGIDKLRIAQKLNLKQDSDYKMDSVQEGIEVNWNKDHISENEIAVFNKISHFYKKNLFINLKNKKSIIFKNDDAKSNINNLIDANQRLLQDYILSISSEKNTIQVFGKSNAYALASLKGNCQNFLFLDQNKKLVAELKNQNKNEKITYLRRDSISFLQSQISKNKKFDIIICEPPSFSRGEKSNFELEKGFKQLIELCLQLMNANSQLVLILNVRDLKILDVKNIVLDYSKVNKLVNLSISNILLSLDTEDLIIKNHFKSFLIQN